MTYLADLFIDGVWRPGSGGERFGVIDPADGTEIARFAVATEDDCMAAVDAAANAQEGWAATAPRERSGGEVHRPERPPVAGPHAPIRAVHAWVTGAFAAM
jgi:hypothetical protein